MNNGHQNGLDPMRGEVPAGEDVESTQPGTLIFENRIDAKGYTSISNYVLKDPNLSVGAKATYALVLCYAWQDNESFPGQVRLAADLGLERKAVNRYLGELKEKSYIETIRRGMGKTNIYVIKDLSRSARISEGKSKREAEKVAKKRKSEGDVPKMGHQDVPKMTNQDVPLMGHNEDTVYEDIDYKDLGNSNSRKKHHHSGGETTSTKLPSSEGKREEKSPAWSDDIAKIVSDLTKFELHDLDDPTNLYRNPKRAMKLWNKSGLSEQVFISLLYEAKEITLKYSSSIRKNVNGSRATKNRAPYFFGVLKNLIDAKRVEILEEHRRAALEKTQGAFPKRMST